ncbi:hypothetical protein Tco_1194538 [Tanacetum coccineum]
MEGVFIVIVPRDSKDETPELITEFQDVDKRVPTIYDYARMKATLNDALSNQFNNAKDVALRKVIYMAINNGIQEGLEACIEHGRAGRSLAAVEAYDSGVEAKYVAAVHNLENVSFPLLDQLEALKDSPLELLMSSLTLEGSYIEDDPTPKFRKSISHEILLSDALAALRARCEKHKKARLEIGGPSVVTPSLSSQEESLAAADHQVSSAANVDGTV